MFAPPISKNRANAVSTSPSGELRAGGAYETRQKRPDLQHDRFEDPTKTAAPSSQRTSQRAERAIGQSELGERGNPNCVCGMPRTPPAHFVPHAARGQGELGLRSRR